MTTMDVQIAFAGFLNAYWNLEDRAQAFVRLVLDWFTDAAAWMKRERVRRRGRQAGAHRSGRSVWEYLESLPEEELQYDWKPAGQHRDTRGWRYRPMVWALIERTSDYRSWERYLAVTIENLMGDIRFMLENPPQVITTHGCKDCLCGTVDIWRAELTEVNA